MDTSRSVKHRFVETLDATIRPKRL